MKKLRIIALLLTSSVVAGCQTTNQLRQVSVEEAFSEIRKLEKAAKSQGKENQQSSRDEHQLYAQPVNKSVPCKLHTTQDQLDRKNFRAYWDGDCKDGFAYGLGRDIAVSDTHHLEEILTYGDNGGSSGSPIVNYDFVHQIINYVQQDDSGDLKFRFAERITNEVGDFNISYDISEYDKNALSKLVKWSAFNPISVFLSGSENVVYKFQYHSIATNNETPVELLQTFKVNSNQRPIGYSIAKFANGLVRHVKEDNGEFVELPTEYVSMLLNKYNEIKETYSRGLEVREQAKRMEKEYLYLACNGEHEISGLEKAVSNKLCTWREQFKEPYELAQKKYNEWLNNSLERMKVEARTQQEQQRLYLEQQRLQQQQKQQAWDALNRGLDSFGESMDSIRRNTPKTTHTNCYNTFGNSVNCTSTTY